MCSALRTILNREAALSNQRRPQTFPQDYTGWPEQEARALPRPTFAGLRNGRAGFGSLPTCFFLLLP